MSILWWDLWLHKLFESTLYREMIDGHCKIDELKIILHIYIWGIYILIAHQIFTSFTILLFNATALVFNQKKKSLSQYFVGKYCIISTKQTTWNKYYTYFIQKFNF